MSLYITCQCGQAFSAPEELAGQTLPCPMCQRPIVVRAATPASLPAAGASLGNATTFQTMSAIAPPQLARGEDDSPWAVWVAAIAGGLALVLVIGLLIYNATRRSVPQLAATTPASATSLPPSAPSAAAATPASETPAAPSKTTLPPAEIPTPMPPQAGLPVTAQVPAGTQLPATPAAAADPAVEGAAFTPPNYGGMVAMPDGKYEVWLPSAPQKLEPALDLAAFLPKPKAAKALIAFGKQGPTEMCCVSTTPGASAAEMFAEMERAFPGEPETKSIKFAGVDARQYDFFSEITEGKFAIRTVAFALDGNGYTLQRLSITGQKETDESRAFFASFRKKKLESNQNEQTQDLK